MASGVQGRMDLTIPRGRSFSLYFVESPESDETAGDAESRETGEMNRMLFERKRFVALKVIV